MPKDSLTTMIAAMLRYLQSAGVTPQQLARAADLPEEQLAQPEPRLSAAQLQRLWLIIQSKLVPGFSFSVQVRPLIQAQLARGKVKVEAIAAQLHMSRHTLYKRLKEENQTFAGLLEDVRREQALVYLRDRHRPLVEIAEQLGFSELSAFSRAFKRWMGVSPAEYRTTGGLA